MKRKLLIILFALACIFCLTFAFAACLDGENAGQNTGNGGNNSENVGGGEHSHVMGVWSIVIKPTCTEQGTIERHCKECSYTETDYVEETGHKEVVDPAVPSKCDFQGKTAGSHCEVCGDVIVKQETIPPLPHTEVIDKAVAPTCTTTGLTAGIHCSVCGTVIVEQQTVKKIDHNPVIDKSVAPTCSEEGLTEGSHCSVCGTVIVEQQTVKKIDHNPVIDKSVAPTCSEEGLTEGSHCEVCKTVLVKQEPIKKIAHSFGTDNYCDECGEDGLFYVRESETSYSVRVGAELKDTLVAVNIPKTHENFPVTKISANGFIKCPNLKSVIIPDTVTEIGSMAFAICEKLEIINIPEGVKSISNSAFVYCSALTEITLGNNIETIGYNAFRYCESLKTVKLGANLQSIGQSAFIYCTSLAEITIPASVAEMGSGVFAHCTALKSVIFKNAEGWTCKFNEDEVSLFGSVLSKPAKAAEYLTDTYCNYAWHSTGEHRHIYGDDNLCDECGFDGLTYELNADKNGYTVARDYSFTTAKKIIISREHLGLPVTAISDHAFTGNIFYLQSVVLPDTVTEIGDSAFSLCANLEEIDLSHVKVIGNAAFATCNFLTDVTFSNNLEVIGNGAFLYCMISNLVIPASVKEIGYMAFGRTMLQSVTFEDAEGWTCSDTYGNDVEFPSSGLTNPTLNAKYFTYTYIGYKWYKA